jgi:hypothetical protein
MANMGRDFLRGAQIWLFCPVLRYIFLFTLFLIISFLVLVDYDPLCDHGETSLDLTYVVANKAYVIIV